MGRSLTLRRLLNPVQGCRSKSEAQLLAKSLAKHRDKTKELEYSPIQRLVVEDSCMPNRPDHFRLFFVGGVALAAVAGFVNAVTLLSPFHVTATHLTGTVSRAAVAVSDPSSSLDARLATLLILSFVAGAAITGASLDSTKLRLGRRYGVLLLLESGLILTSSLLLSDNVMFGLLVVATASGIQNALATQYSQAIVRTTHVTGLVTDLGIALGKFIARRGVEVWRPQLHFGILAGFILGGMLGARGWDALGPQALMIPAGFLAILSVAYWAVRDRLSP